MVSSAPQLGSKVRAEMKALLDSQAGGILATIRPDGDPHLVYMLCAATDDLEVVLVSDPNHEHTRQMEAHPRVAFLVDTRERIAESTSAFQRLEVRGEAAIVTADHPDFPALHRALLARTSLMRGFLERGCQVYRIQPTVLQLSRGGERLEYLPGSKGGSV